MPGDICTGDREVVLLVIYRIYDLRRQGMGVSRSLTAEHKARAERYRDLYSIYILADWW